ncbi:EAL and HDOD domain-containing protein [Marinomonas posidonica]|uniref:Diguanylate phosphodiesterase metal dependent hydrolase domain protein n=1 Tax=Marinomonas posidonica (strain CECT 7376 / NCIMB 14433 / IVIA-Po-181) TaxID=491952 RepID=F6D0W6_MARPP|nr:HDOD domain-containing protein [Marinomonas posidonica]AEF53689.1 diguanylate phosphodiesterase metal dependent hydrolase domain protein [Marinomonas posidonica IVIA-Po-181]
MAEQETCVHSDVAVARQPIVDEHLAVMGYELLYRKSVLAHHADVVDEVGATAQVLSASMFELGMENLVGCNKAFVNFPRSYLLSANGIPTSRENLVVEVLETAGFDANLLAALRRWKSAGCLLALDDFVFESKLTPFVELADYVKLDILSLGHGGFHKQVEALRGFEVKLIAEKVETWEDYQFCRLLGVEYFQGYFFEKPELMTAKSSRVNSMTLLRLMSSLLDTTNLDVDDIEQIVSQDAGLVHKLLRYLNSPMTGLMVSVDSVRLAIMLIGVEKLKALTNLLLMSEMIGEQHALLEQIIIRAKHAELMAIYRSYDNQDKYFLAGMLSMMDVCTGMPLEEVLGELPLPNEFINAIVHRVGRVGETLDLVDRYSNQRSIESGQDLDDLQGTYLAALKWSDEFLTQI